MDPNQNPPQDPNQPLQPTPQQLPQNPTTNPTGVVANPVVQNQNQTATPPPQNSQKTSPAITIITAALLLLIFPIGLLLMWLGTKWPKKIKIFITLIPVIMIIIGIAVILLSAGLASKNPETSATNTITTPTPAANVQTQGSRVTNTDGGYSFTLPTTWKSKVSSFSKTDTIFGTTFLNDLGIGDIRVSTGDKSLSDAINKKSTNTITNKTKTTVDGVDAYSEDFSGGDKTIHINGKATIIYKAGKTYTIEILSNDPGDIAKYEQIVSSFKFQ